MSGYLQRLASQAAKSQGNVRPLVNPLTGPTTAAPRREPLEEIVYRTVDQSKRISKEMETPSGMSGEESGKGLAQGARDRVVRESQELSQFEPLLSTKDQGSPTPTNHAGKIPPLRQEDSDKAQDRGSQTIFVKEGAHARAGRDLTRSSIARRLPTLGEVAVDEVYPQEVRLLNASPASRPDAHLLRNSTSASHGPDEIQINIGRIEVTAMPQSTLHPAPAARKSINLDEYLTRRNGRNG